MYWASIHGGSFFLGDGWYMFIQYWLYRPISGWFNHVKRVWLGCKPWNQSPSGVQVSWCFPCPPAAHFKPRGAQFRAAPKGGAHWARHAGSGKAWSYMGHGLSILGWENQRHCHFCYFIGNYMVFRELRDEVQVVKIPDQPILLSIELLDCAFKTHH